MPHSVSRNASASPDQDAIIEEPKPENVEMQENERTAIPDSIGPIGESQDSESQDITMADALTEEGPRPIKAENATEIKLEDLFADVDSDEEFPSATAQDSKVLSSPQAPVSPV